MLQWSSQKVTDPEVLSKLISQHGAPRYEEVKVVIASWRRHYNEERPHSSLAYMTPHEFKAKSSSTMSTVTILK